MSDTTSHVQGATDLPLFEDTIGVILDRAVSRWPEREALVSVYQGARWTYAELGAAHRMKPVSAISHSQRRFAAIVLASVLVLVACRHQREPAAQAAEVATSGAASATPASEAHIRAVTGAVDEAWLRANSSSTNDWPCHGLDAAETRFSTWPTASSATACRASTAAATFTTWATSAPMCSQTWRGPSSTARSSVRACRISPASSRR
jgi:hypothetical protein